MKNQEQPNNGANLIPQPVADDPQAQFEDLPISEEQEERVKGRGEEIKGHQWIDVLSVSYNRGNSAQDDKLIGSVLSFEIK